MSLLLIRHSSNLVTRSHIAAREAGQPRKCLIETSIMWKRTGEGTRRTSSEPSATGQGLLFPCTCCFVRKHFPRKLPSGLELLKRVTQSERVSPWDFKSRLLNNYTVVTGSCVKYIEMRWLLLKLIFFLELLSASFFFTVFDICLILSFILVFLCVGRYGTGSGLGETVLQGLL